MTRPSLTANQSNIIGWMKQGWSLVEDTTESVFNPNRYWLVAGTAKMKAEQKSVSALCAKGYLTRQDGTPVATYTLNS